MSRSRHHSHRRRSTGPATSFRTYVLITAACGLLALLVNLLYDAPEKVSEYADKRIQSAVNDAIKAEMEQKVRERVR